MESAEVAVCITFEAYFGLILFSLLVFLYLWKKKIGAIRRQSPLLLGSYILSIEVYLVVLYLSLCESIDGSVATTVITYLVEVILRASFFRFAH